MTKVSHSTPFLEDFDKLDAATASTIAKIPQRIVNMVDNLPKYSLTVSNMTMSIKARDKITVVYKYISSRGGKSDKIIARKILFR